jgi:mannan endo-1,6-alpha-mannosidase
MFARAGLLSLAFSLLAQQGVALDLDTGNQDSIKSAAKTLAGGIIAAYNKSLEATQTPGIFGEPHYWWQAGTTFNALLEYSKLTGDSQYDSLISEALLHQRGENNDYMPANASTELGNEEQSTWALAALTAAENGFQKPKDAAWVDYAITVAEQQAERFEVEQKGNGTCGGGLRWQIFPFLEGYDYKDARSNANFFLLAARLGRFTGNQTYNQWAEASYLWAKEIGLITDDFAVFDGAGVTSNCSEINKIQWTYTLAVYTEGSAVLYNAVSAEDFMMCFRSLD